MKGNNDNDEVNHSELVDPLQFVPNEIASKFFSFLPPHSIAHSSAVSPDWRKVVHSDSTLHREIDLLPPEGEDEVRPRVREDLANLHRLSSLALNQVVKISLSITWIFLGFNSTSKRNEIDDLLLALKFASGNNSLQELNLLLRFPLDSFRSDKVIPFFLELLEGLQTHRRLRKIFIRAPIGFLSFKTGGEDNLGAKEVEFVDNSPGLIEYSIEMILSLMKSAKKLAGGGLTEFKANSSYSSMVPLMNELSLSKFSLRKLELSNWDSIHFRQLWTISLECINLVSLDLELRGQFIENEIFIAPDPGSRTSRLRFFRILVNNVVVDWKALGKWVGTQLEDVSVALDVFDVSQQAEFVNHQGILTSIVIPSRATLRSITLWRVGCEQEELSSLNEKIHFPNLQKLNVDLGSANLNKFFSSAECSNLHNLSGHNVKRSHSRAARAFLIRMLKKHDSNLTHLGFYVKEGVKFRPPPESLTFSFPRLKSLRLGNENQSSAEFFSRFQFPSLTVLDDEMEHYDLFKSQAPNLVEPRFKWGRSETGERQIVPRYGTWEDYVMGLEEERKKEADLKKAE